MTSNEEYRELIIKMLNQIHSNLRLRRIYTIVHCIFIRESSEEVNE